MSVTLSDWPIPTPDAIADRAASAFEAEYARLWALRNPDAPPATVDARSDFSSLAVQARVTGKIAFDVWIFLALLSRELMPDRAVLYLSRFGSIWGVPRIVATPAIGNAVFASGIAMTVPSGLALSGPGGAQYLTTASVPMSGGFATVPVAAVVAGAAGSMPASTVLTVVNPLGGLTQQTATVDTNGLTGTDDEDIEVWRGRIIQRIRERGAGGNEADFEGWVKEVYPAALVKAYSPQVGQITVAFAMPQGGGWRVPTSPEIAAVFAYVNDASKRKPLGCPVVAVIAVTLQTVNVSLHLNPDSTVTRAGATNAVAAWFIADATIGGTMFVSRLDAALENASGEFSHERATPAADVAAGTISSLPVMGTVGFT